jgi:two-component sensor histidine kinase
LALIFNELLTNVIRHSGLGSHDLADISLELGDRVRGSVADRGRGFDPKTIPAPATSGEGGFGLTIVDGLTSKWGVRRGRSPDSPNEVWFEL